MISTSARSVEHTGNDVATAFAFSFRIYGASELTVCQVTDLGVQSKLVLDTDYTVTGIGQNAGTVTLTGGALPQDYILVIVRRSDNLQSVDFRNDGFHAENFELALDKMTVMAQENILREYATDETHPTACEAYKGWSITFRKTGESAQRQECIQGSDGTYAWQSYVVGAY